MKTIDYMTFRLIFCIYMYKRYIAFTRFVSEMEMNFFLHLSIATEQNITISQSTGRF